METNDETPTTEQPAPASEPAPPDTPKLMRSSDDRLIAGVCGGIAERYGVDVGFVRILAVLFAFVGGSTILVYLAAVLLLPQNDGQGNPVERVQYRRAAQVAGFVAMGIALLMVLDATAGSDSVIWWPSFGTAAFVLLVAAAAVAAGRRLRAPIPDGAAPPRFGRLVGVLLIAAAAVAATVVLLGLSTITTLLAGAVPAAIAVLLLGVLMLALSVSGRRAYWLAIPALAIAAPATLLASADMRIDDSAGERRYAPVTEGALLPEYKLGIGATQVDLRRMVWPKDRPLVVRITTGVGEARIVVPQGVCVRSDSHVKVGEELLLGSSWQGTSLNEPRGQLDRWPGRRLLVEGKVEVGQLVVTQRPWDSDRGPGSALEDRWPDRDEPGITRAMAAAGCAGRSS